MLRSSGIERNTPPWRRTARIVQANGARGRHATSNEKARNAASAERRADIVAAARELYEEQGLSKTSVQDITNRMGVARSLFYHYFPDKEAVTSAVLDDYVADFIEATHYWNAQRHPGDIESALSSVVKLMRLGVFEHDAFRRSLARTRTRRFTSTS